VSKCHIITIKNVIALFDGFDKKKVTLAWPLVLRVKNAGNR